MSLIGEVFGASPFTGMLRHTEKVCECVRLVIPLMRAVIDGEYEKVRQLQDQISKLEYEADKIKHQIRENLPHRYFLPVSHGDIEMYLSKQDEIADMVEDLAVIMIIRRTVIRPELAGKFLKFAGHVVSLSETLMGAAKEMQNLAETSFGGAEAEQVLQRISGLCEGEWKADRMQRELSINIYENEADMDPITVYFYDKILMALSGIANATENTGDVLRMMIVK